MSSVRPAAEPLAIEGPAGGLEALFELPAGGEGAARGVAVVCHPHPLHGGTMHNKVAYMLARSLLELGFAALRFNYRGVGESEGAYGHGDGETADAVAVMDWAAARMPGAPLLLGGFSFGGAVALRAGMERDAVYIIAVAPAVDRFELDTVWPRCPWLIVQGGADELVDAASVQAFAARQPGEVIFVLEPGVGHFFHGKLVQLKRRVHEHLRSAIP